MAVHWALQITQLADPRAREEWCRLAVVPDEATHDQCECVSGDLCCEHHAWEREWRRTWTLSRQQNSNIASGGGARFGEKWDRWWEDSHGKREIQAETRTWGSLGHIWEPSVQRSHQQHPETHSHFPPLTFTAFNCFWVMKAVSMASVQTDLQSKWNV